MIVVFMTLKWWSMRGGFSCLCPEESITSLGVSLMKTPMEHSLDDLCPVLHFTATIFRKQCIM